MVGNRNLISLDFSGESLYLEVLVSAKVESIFGKGWKQLLLEQFVQLEAIFLFLVSGLTIDSVLS